MESMDYYLDLVNQLLDEQTNTWEEEFLENIQTQLRLNRRLTQKQIDIIEQMARRKNFI